MQKGLKCISKFKDQIKLIEEESISVLNAAGKQQYRINCYHTPSNVMVNSRYLLHFITELMPDIMDILHQNKHFNEIVSDSTVNNQNQNDLFTNCNKICGENSDSVECNTCFAWYHYKCLSFTKEQNERKYMNKVGDFFCRGCSYMKEFIDDELVKVRSPLSQNIKSGNEIGIISKLSRTDTMTIVEYKLFCLES